MAERILVVDDQRTNAEMVSGLLRNLGYEVDVALEAEAALERVRAAAPDLRRLRHPHAAHGRLRVRAAACAPTRRPRCCR